MNIILLGPPGTGKGTQAERISKEFKIPHISTGDIFRENIKNRTNLGRKANEFIKKGNLVPDEITINMLKDRLKKQDSKKGFILDGFPRTIEQAKALEEMHLKIDIVLNITSSDKVIIRRLSKRRSCRECKAVYHLVYKPTKKAGVCDKCGGELYLRDDDKPETVKKRLEVYEKQTKPLVAYYSKKDLIKNIDGGKEIDEVFEGIKKTICHKQH